jgi:hypothetical protein
LFVTTQTGSRGEPVAIPDKDCIKRYQVSLSHQPGR